jgi:hypothetical protein
VLVQLILVLEGEAVVVLAQVQLLLVVLEALVSAL